MQQLITPSSWNKYCCLWAAKVCLMQNYTIQKVLDWLIDLKFSGLMRVCMKKMKVNFVARDQVQKSYILCNNRLYLAGLIKL